MSAHEQDNASAQGSPIAALERENELLYHFCIAFRSFSLLTDYFINTSAILSNTEMVLWQELAAAKEREKWLQHQIDQIQQRLLPPLRQGIIERIAEAIARLRRPKGNA